MTRMAWVLCVMLLGYYSVGAFTVGPLTYRKGYMVLGLVGTVLPLLWLIGATLPAKRRSRYAVSQAVEFLQQNFAAERQTGISGTWHSPRWRWEFPGSDWGYPGSDRW